MTVWYDFTTTVRNRGRSGIAAVEWNVGQALTDMVPGSRCFELVGRRGLVEIDPAVRLADAVYATSDVASMDSINAVPTWRDDVRQALRSRLGVRADPIIRTFSSLYQGSKQLRRIRDVGWRRPVRRGRTASLADVVLPDDVVVSMGADWDGELSRRLGALRQRTGCSVVTMVYDLVPLTHTHLAFHNDPALFERYYRSLIDISDLITCISEQSRCDLIEFAERRGLALPQTGVLVLGESPPPAEGASLPRSDFFLCVGTIERRKNLELVYDALRVIEAEGRDVPVVVVAGAPGWGTRDFLQELDCRSTRASRSMVLLGPVDDEMLDHLYRSARALLFPSHFEGWGLPVREAAIRGCPVAAGDSPAIREAAAGFGGAVFLPTNDAGPWADFMLGDVGEPEPAEIRPWASVGTDLLEMISEFASAEPSRCPSGWEADR